MRQNRILFNDQDYTQEKANVIVERFSPIYLHLQQDETNKSKNPTFVIEKDTLWDIIDVKISCGAMDNTLFDYEKLAKNIVEELRKYELSGS